MLPELGHFALILATMLALLQSAVPLWGAQRGDHGLMGVGQPCALLQLVFVAFSFMALVHAYVTSDFSVINVAENSHSTKPLLYKITGVWGNHEGSMLLWVLILALFGAAVALFGGELPATLRARVLAVQGMVAAGFGLFILLTSNPFLRLFPAPADGRGLNPILQDPGLAFHPPFLYLGYVGYSITFAFAVAGLLEGKVDALWARWVRVWSLAAWIPLTIGIATGSWWAYYTLGWGGWWFWDPVENASFMPWLVGTALLHSVIVVEKRESLKTWTVLLALVAFSLSLVGTFLVRSGVLTSVHAFAVDPQRGSFILLLLAATIGGSMTLYAMRAPAFRSGGVFAPVSREGALVLNNLLLSTATATVFVGTIYPLIVDVMGGGKISVGPPFFNATFAPLMVPLLIAVAFGPFMGWKRGDALGALQRLWIAFAGAILLMAVALYATGGGPLLAIGGLGIGAWVAIGVVVEWAERVHLFKAPFAESLRRARSRPLAAHGMTLAHLGLAITTFGVAASAWEVERIVAMRPGDATTISGYTLRLDAVDKQVGANFLADRATIVLLRDGAEIATLHPERRLFNVQRRVTSHTSIRTTMLSDIYVALGDPDPAGGWVVRAYWKPLVPWIWIGAGLMALGGMLSICDRRWRVAVPVRRQRQNPVATPATAAGAAD
ncbi:MAG: heme lyase CcmF/NrfE family subunit [Rhodospirillales bacterium]